MLKKIDHFVITTKDKAQCAEFYQKLGFKLLDDGKRYELLAGDFKINVHFLGHELEPKAQHVQTGSADLCFELDVAMESFCAHLREQGIAIEMGPVQRHGVRGSMQSVYVRDPDGNLLEFCHY